MIGQEDMKNCIGILHSYAIVAFDKKLYSICEDVLNTQDIRETTSIGFAALLYGGLAYRRDGTPQTDKICTSYLDVATNLYPEIRPLLDEIGSVILKRKSEIEELSQKRNCHIYDALSWVISEWTIEKLTRGKKGSGFTEAVQYVADQIYNAQGFIKIPSRGLLSRLFALFRPS